MLGACCGAGGGERGQAQPTTAYFFRKSLKFLDFYFASCLCTHLHILLLLGNITAFFLPCHVVGDCPCCPWGGWSRVPLERRGQGLDARHLVLGAMARQFWEVASGEAELATTVPGGPWGVFASGWSPRCCPVRYWVRGCRPGHTTDIPLAQPVWLFFSQMEPVVEISIKKDVASVVDMMSS